VSLLLCILLSTGCGSFYPKEPAFTHPVNVSWDLQKEGPVRIGYERRVSIEEIGDAGDGKFRVFTQAVPVCAAGHSGSVRYVPEEVYEKDKKAVKAAGWAFGLLGSATLLPVAIFGVLSKGQDADSRKKMHTSMALLALLSAGSFASAIAWVAAPKWRKVRLPPETQQAATVAQQDWQTCERSFPIASPVHLVFSTLGGSYAIDVRTGRDGTYVIDDALAADLRRWRSSCGTPIRVWAQLGRGTGTSFKPYDDRQAQRMVDDVFDGRFDPSRHRLAWKLQNQLPNERRKDALELGPKAGKSGSGRWPSFKQGYYEVKDTRFSRPFSHHEIAGYANVCIQNRERYRRRNCRNSHSSKVSATCTRQCTKPDKVELCELKREMCTEQTAGIGGSMAAECDQKQRDCMVQVGQDPRSLQACTNRCVAKALNKICH